MDLYSRNNYVFFLSCKTFQYTQTYSNIEVIARDDGSIDNTLDILKSYGVNILDSKQSLGAKGSFASLLDFAIKNSDADYFMFCDQDDVWEENKIEITISKMEQMEKEYGRIPALVHTDLKVVNENLELKNESMWEYEHIDPTKNSFNRLLIQNTITGCTMLINRKLAELSLPIPKDCIMHDWWMGLVASGFGKIGYLNDTTIKYRQHCSNDTGAKEYSYNNILQKAFSFFLKDELYVKHLRKNINQAKAFLDMFHDRLDQKEIELLENFISIESKSFFQKRKTIIKYKLFKYGTIRNLGLLLRI